MVVSRYSFYDSLVDEFIGPEEALNYRFEHDGNYYVGLSLTATGDVFSLRESDYIGKIFNSRFSQCASTGLEDSEGNEIFEGHILSDKNHNPGQNGFVYYCDGIFRVRVGPDDVSDSILLNQATGEKILGHALTDPDLVPDSYGVEEYFELDDDLIDYVTDKTD